ncbi:MAG: hypothetical protein QM785_16550 [Pyrinomonadaceae bacterium]
MRFSQFLTYLACFLITANAVVAQKPTPTPERNREIVALLNNARFAAPELAVDTFLRVVESKKVKDPDWRREILEEALRMADDVKYPIRRERAFRGTGIVDTVSGYMTYAFDQKLDTLSIKARIIKDILPDDKDRARQLVFQIGGDLKLKPLTCDDALGYNVEDIYTSVGAVANAAFTAAEIKDGARGLFLLPWIDNIQSPSQIKPAIEMLTIIQRGPTVERRLLINTLERAINRNFSDDLSFSHAFRRDAHKAAAFLMASDNKEESMSAWRDMIVKNSAGPRCLESKPKKGELPQPASTYNPIFSEEKQFKLEDFESVEYRGEPKDKLYLDSPMYKKVSVLYKTAREKKNLPENKEDKAAQLEWQLKVSEVLDLLDSWKATADEPEREVFNLKAGWYGDVIDQVEEPAVKLIVIRAFLRYLAGSPMQKDSFIEWLLYAKGTAAKFPDEFKNIVGEFPNPNFKVMIDSKKVLSSAADRSPKITVK